MNPPSQKQIRTVALASLLGATIEWYDFFLYGVVAGIVFNKLYFPTDDPFIGTLLAYSTFAIGYLARPFGAFVFGHFGDKIGRKSMLVLTMLIMGVATIGIGLVPTYAQIGIAAPIILQTLNWCDRISIYRYHLALIGTSIPYQQDQYITLTAAIIFTDLFHFSRIIDTGKKIGLQISSWHIRSTLIEDLIILILLNGILQGLPVCHAKDAGYDSESCCKYSNKYPNLRIYTLDF